MLDGDTGSELDPLRDPRIIALRVDRDLAAALPELGRAADDVDVLTAGGHPAQKRERARMLGNHRDSHTRTSLPSSSRV